MNLVEQILTAQALSYVISLPIIFFWYYKEGRLKMFSDYLKNGTTAERLQTAIWLLIVIGMGPLSLLGKCFMWMEENC